MRAGYHRVRIEDFAATNLGIHLYSEMAAFAVRSDPESTTILQHAAEEVIGELHGHSLGSHDTSAGKKAVESQFGKWRALDQ